MFLQTEGRLKGCWVMPIEDGARPDAADDPLSRERRRRGRAARESHRPIERHGDLRRQGHRQSVLEVRPARQGLQLPRLRAARRPPLWATTSHAGEAAACRRSAARRPCYNVIDSRQSYLQQLLKQALATMGFAREAASSTHFSYEMVALSHATARALGYEDTESDGKPFVEVSGRKGLGVKADDLLDRLIETAERRSHGAQSRARPGRSAANGARRSPLRPCATSS